MAVEWLATDQIAVFDGVSKNLFSVKTSSGSSASFEGPVDEGATEFYAAYPASLATSLSAGVIATEIPAEQVVPTGKNVGDGALVSVAYTTGNSFSFKNVCSLFKITLTDSDITSVTVSSIGGEAMAGGCNVSVSATPTLNFTSGVSSVVMRPEAGTFATGTYYIAIAPGTYTGGLAVVLTHSADSQGGLKQGSADVTVVRNNGVNLGTITAAGCTWGTYITNLADLRNWSSSGDFTAPAILGADIEVGEWYSYYRGSAFSSTFYGLGHKLYNMTCTASSGSNPAAFLCQPTNVRDLIIGSSDGENWDGVSTFTLGASSNGYCGLFAYSKSDGTYKNIINFAKIMVTTAKTGTNFVRVGSICGATNGGTFTNCINYGDVECRAQTTSAETLVGGLFGFVDAGTTTATDCENHGNVTTYCPRTCYMGGITSRTQNNTSYQRTFTGCKNYGAVSAFSGYSGELFIGGIVGKAYKTTIASCVNEGAVSLGTAEAALTITVCGAGGILGYSEDGTKFWGNTNRGDVLAHADASTLVAASGLIASSYYVTSGKFNENEGNVTVRNENASGPAAAGGCYGAEYKSTHGNIITNPWLERFSNSGNITASAASNIAYAGGVGGYLVGMRFWDAYNTGAVTGYDNTITGSFAGRCDTNYANIGCAGSVNGTVLSSENWSAYKMGTSSTGSSSDDSYSGYSKPGNWGTWNGVVS